MIVLPENSFYWGKIHPQPFACIVNSSQSKTPTGNEEWILNSQKAVERIRRNNFVLLSSIGINTYEIYNYFAKENKCPIVLVINIDKSSDHRAVAESVITDFNLDRHLTGFIFVHTETPKNKPKSFWQERDELIISLAKYIIPVSINQSGNMNKIISRIGNNKLLIDDLRVPYLKSKSTPKYTLDKINPKIDSILENYITHWTHTCYGPFYSENRDLFFKDILSSSKVYPRNAKMCLGRIILEKQIYSSTEKFRNNTPAICFTNLPPSEAAELMKWSNRYVRYYIEPYGIAIKKSIAENLGVKPVIYGKSSDYEVLDSEDKPYFQSIGNSANWDREKEWRHIGDLDLSDIPNNAVKIITYKSKEIDGFSRTSNWDVLSLT